MNDTCFGINNEGGLSFDYYHEDTDQVDGANVYNGQNSTLWVNFRQSFPDLIKETYQYLRSNSVLNYDELTDQFITKGSDKWSESVYNEDGDFKYVSMLRSENDATNLPQIRGTGEEHFRYFIENRLNYCDSKWYAGSYPEDNAIVRIYTPVDENGSPRTDLAVPANANITVTPYSNMYAGVRYKANGTLVQERLKANETYTFVAPNETFNDTETAIYGASQLSSLGDLAPLYLGYIDVGAATKLVELKIGDDTEGYQNSNLYHLAVGTNRLLKKIDIQNCIGFDQALVLTGCPNIEEVYAKGSGITGVDLPNSGYLKILHLPSTITNLTLKNQLYIEDLTIEGLTNLKTITIENTPVDSLRILDDAVNVERVRLTDVDWHYEDCSILYELIGRDIGGIDENGVNTDTMWIDGKCHIETLTGAEYSEIKTLYPYLDITYTTLASKLTYMSEDGSEKLYEETVYNGGDGAADFEYESENTLKCELGSIDYISGALSDSTTRLRTDFISTGGVSTLNLSFNDMPYTKFLVRIYKTDGSYVSFKTNSAAAWTGTIKDNWYIIDTNTGTFNLSAYVGSVGLTANDIKNIRFIFAIDDATDITEINRGSIGINDVVYYLVSDGQSIFYKPPTAQYNFRFGGWSLIPNGEPNPDAVMHVEGDRIVYAAYYKTIRYYDVYFYNGNELLERHNVPYGTMVYYTGGTPVINTDDNIDEWEFYGWDPEPTSVKGETFYYAQYMFIGAYSRKLINRTISGYYSNDNIIRVEAYAFSNCTKLTSIDFPNTTKIGNYAFNGCTELNNVNIPNVTSLGEKSFYGCAKIKSLSLPGFTSIPDCAVNSGILNGMTFNELQLPNVTKLGYHGLSGLTINGNLELPLVTNMYREHIAGLKCNRLVLPSVTVMQDSSFMKHACKVIDFHKLTYIQNISSMSITRPSIIIRTPNAVCTLGSSVAAGTINLYVPSTLLADYKMATNWSAMADYIFAIEDNPEICVGVTE